MLKRLVGIHAMEAPRILTSLHWTAAALALALAQVAPAAQVRNWTSAGGRQLEAEFQAFKDGSVILVTPQGRRISIAYDRLSRADRDFLAGHLPGPECEIKDVKLKGWERTDQGGGTVAVFAVRVLLKSRGVVRNPDLHLDVTMDTSERYYVNEKRKVRDPRTGRLRNRNVRVNKKRSGSVSGAYHGKLFVEQAGVVDLGRMPGIMDLELRTGVTRKDKTTYRLRRTKAEVKLGDEVLAWYHGS